MYGYFLWLNFFSLPPLGINLSTLLSITLYLSTLLKQFREKPCTKSRFICAFALDLKRTQG